MVGVSLEKLTGSWVCGPGVQERVTAGELNWPSPGQGVGQYICSWSHCAHVGGWRLKLTWRGLHPHCQAPGCPSAPIHQLIPCRYCVPGLFCSKYIFFPSQQNRAKSTGSSDNYSLINKSLRRRAVQTPGGARCISREAPPR